MEAASKSCLYLAECLPLEQTAEAAQSNRRIAALVVIRKDACLA